MLPDRYVKPQGMSVTINFKETDEIERVYKGLSEGAAKIDMPLEQTFWARRFAFLTDRFGIPWMLNCE